MKVGILTRRYGHNHGSTLQALAMSLIVCQIGHDPEIIDYDETCAHPQWRIKPILDHFLFKIRCILPKSKQQYLNARIAQEKRFKKFEHNYFPLSTIHITSTDGLSKLSTKYKKILIGSDQIWNPFLYDANYFGAFTEDKNKLIAYAPSLGISKINLISKEMKDLLNKLPYISCREKEGAGILSSITRKEVPVVLDPTLMVNKETWLTIARNHSVPNIPSKYILTYYLGKNVHQEEVTNRSREMGLPIVNIAMFNRPNSLRADFTVTDLGPGEFLSLIQNADYVFTDSFHALIFSWIFERKFTVFERFQLNEVENQNSRIHTLIKVLGCEDRLWGKQSCKSEGTLKENRKISWDYLNNSMQ